MEPSLHRSESEQMKLVSIISESIALSEGSVYTFHETAEHIIDDLKNNGYSIVKTNHESGS